VLVIGPLCVTRRVYTSFTKANEWS